MLDEGPSRGEGVAALSRLRLAPAASIISSPQEQHDTTWILNPSWPSLAQLHQRLRARAGSWEGNIDPRHGRLACASAERGFT